MTHEEAVVYLQGKYRGLRREDIPEMNPTYACVVCSKICKIKLGFCPCHNPATEEEFALQYDFGGRSE